VICSWAGLAAAYIVAPSWGFTDREYYELANSAANAAIGLEPDLPLPYTVLAYGFSARLPLNLEAAQTNYDKALVLDDKQTTALLWRGAFLSDLGYFDQAESDLVRCLEIDPANKSCRGWLATVSLFAGKPDEAMKLYRQGWLEGYPENGSGISYMQLALGNSDAVLVGLAGWYRQRDAVELIAPVFDAMTNRDFDFESRRALAEATYRGAYGEELVWGADDFFAFNFKNYAAIRNYPGSAFWWYPYPDDFKTSPHRKRMIRDFGIFEYWQKYGFPPQCRAVGDDDFECD
jgi:tetratricopeptide (TPR) repeat protein